MKIKQLRLVKAERNSEKVQVKKNLDSLSNIGLTVQDVKKELLSLEMRDYKSGPELDYSYSGEVWIFSRVVGNAEFYIKLKIDVANDGTQILKCLSFHN